MSKSRKKINRKRTKKRRVRKMRLLIVILFLVLFIFAIIKGSMWASQTIKGIQEKQITQDTEPPKQVEQFDLEEEVNKDLGKKYTVLIDPGHGGKDKGTMNNSKTIYEKDLTLQISKRVANKLSKQNDVQVMISRIDDQFVSLSDRVKLAKDNNVDLLVSIHLNAEGGGNSATGVETYYRRGATDDSKELAETVQKTIRTYIDVRDRGVKEDIYQVLRDSDMPAILIECGFLTNVEETKKLMDSNYQNDLSDGIAQGILTFLDSR